MERAAPAGGDERANTGWPWVLLALVLLWPLEIAIRRRFMPWR
jgi:hypothetical protein